jgi:hypothetical protein
LDDILERTDTGRVKPCDLRTEPLIPRPAVEFGEEVIAGDIRNEILDWSDT